MSEVRAARTRYREARAAWRGPRRRRARVGDAVREPARRPAAGAVRGTRGGRVLELRAGVRVRAQRPHPAGRDVAGRGAQGGRPRPGRGARRAGRRRALSRRGGVARGREPRGAAAPVAGARVCRRRRPGGWSRSARGPHASSSSRPCRVRSAGPLRGRGRAGACAVSAGRARRGDASSSGADDRLAFRAARELDRRPALAVLVAPAPSGRCARDAAVTKVVRRCCASAGRRRSSPSPLPAPAREPGVGRRATAGPGGGGSPAAACRSPGCPAAGQAGAGRRRRRALVAAARANVQTLVRACWPGTLAPAPHARRASASPSSTRATPASASAGSDTAATSALLQRLRLWGFTAARLLGRRRRLGRRRDAGAAIALPAGVRWRPRWPWPATWDCRQEVSSGLTTRRARAGRARPVD